MIENLRKMLVGRKVSIAHSGNNTLTDRTGTCIAVHRIPGDSTDHFDIELSDQSRFEFFVESVQTDFIVGGLGNTRGKRTITVC